ncbi:MAG: hypothetical protein R2857_06505 [Vampirovibrionales bacterium]
MYPMSSSYTSAMPSPSTYTAPSPVPSSTSYPMTSPLDSSSTTMGSFSTIPTTTTTTSTSYSPVTAPAPTPVPAPVPAPAPVAPANSPAPAPSNNIMPQGDIRKAYDNEYGRLARGIDEALGNHDFSGALQLVINFENRWHSFKPELEGIKIFYDDAVVSSAQNQKNYEDQKSKKQAELSMARSMNNQAEITRLEGEIARIDALLKVISEVRQDIFKNLESVNAVLWSVTPIDHDGNPNTPKQTGVQTATEKFREKIENRAKMYSSYNSPAPAPSVPTMPTMTGM